MKLRGQNKKEQSYVYNVGKKKRILFIGYYLPPLEGSHSNRLRNFINYLDDFGWKVDVLTSSPPLSFSHCDNTPSSRFRESVMVFRTSHGFLNKTYYKVLQTGDRKRRHESTSDNKVTAGGFFSCFLKIIGPIANTAMVPDSSIEWYPFGVYQGLKLTKKYKYDLLISSALPVTCHLIAYTIKKRRGIPWIADYGDPWVFNPAFNPKRIKFGIVYKIEQKVLALADAVVVTTEETKQDYLKHYPTLSEEKVTVIPMGADYDLFNGATIERSEKFRILYTGAIYGIRNIEPFLDAVRLFYEEQKLENDIEILFAGSIDNRTMKLIESKQLQGTIQLLGNLQSDKIPPLLKGANVLLFLGNRGGLQVPGKLFEYLAARRPILCIKGNEKEPSLRFFEGLNRGIIVNNETKEIYSALIQLYSFYKKGTLDAVFSLAEMPDVFWRDRVNRLDKICGKLLNANN